MHQWHVTVGKNNVRSDLEEILKDEEMKYGMKQLDIYIYIYISS